MLKQIFNTEQLRKVVTPDDVWRWKLKNNYKDVDTAVVEIVNYWRRNNLQLSPLEHKIANGRTVYLPVSYTHLTLPTIYSV